MTKQLNKLLMRHLAIACLLLGCVYANARQISQSEAMTLASDFMKSEELRSASGAETLTPMKAPGVNVDSQSPYYVFNRGESDGFVIISGDDRAPKILGYSDRGFFDAANLPPQLKAMMEQWASQMEKLPAFAEQHPSWSKTPASRAGEVLLETADWGQGYPYNSKCPVIDGEQAPAGCVATAMAIVMKYHKWPETTQGKEYTNYNNRSQTVDFSSQIIDWNALEEPLESETFQTAVADLNVLLGVATDMQYSSLASSAAMWTAAHQLTQFFKYSPECQYIERKAFDDEMWSQIIRDQIDSNGPVIYSGDGGLFSEGHAYVIDGYNHEGLFHVNWGWDGACNGYYSVDGLIPDDRDFSQNAGLTINIVPDHSGRVYSSAFIPNADTYLDSVIRYNDYNFSACEITPNEKFSFYSPFISYPWKFNGFIGVAIVDENDNIVTKLFDDDPEKSLIDSPHLNHIVLEDGCIRPGAPLQMNDFVSPGLSAGQRYQIVCLEDDDAEWRIVTGGIIHPSYFGDKELNSEYAQVNIDYDRSLPIIPEIDRPDHFESIKQNSCVITFFGGGGVISIDGKCHDVGKEDVEPSQSFIVGSRREHYAAIVSLYEDINDFTIRWEKFSNNRHDERRESSKVVDVDGLVYYVDDGNASLLGYENIDSESLKIPGSIVVNGNVCPVVAVEDNALTNCEVLKHIALPPSLKNVYPYGLGNLENLESLAISSDIVFSRVASAWSYGLKNIYLLSPETVNCNLEYLNRRYTKSVFDFEPLYVKVYSSFIGYNGFAGYQSSVYSPGRGWINDGSINDEMWTYAIDRDHNCVLINPRIDEIKIMNVKINGQAVEPDENCVYSVPSVQDMEVTVNYILNGHQEMTTVYDANYNNGLPSQTITQSVDGVIFEVDASAVYTLDGVLVSESADDASLRSLTPGIYIVRRGAETQKLVIR